MQYGKYSPGFEGPELTDGGLDGGLELPSSSSSSSEMNGKPTAFVIKMPLQELLFILD